MVLQHPAEDLPPPCDALDSCQTLPADVLLWHVGQLLAKDDFETHQPENRQKQETSRNHATGVKVAPAAVVKAPAAQDQRSEQLMQQHIEAASEGTRQLQQHQLAASNAYN